jgi:hypothetical protein
MRPSCADGPTASSALSAAGMGGSKSADKTATGSRRSTRARRSRTRWPILLRWPAPADRHSKLRR